MNYYRSIHLVSGNMWQFMREGEEEDGEELISLLDKDDECNVHTQLYFGSKDPLL